MLAGGKRIMRLSVIGACLAAAAVSGRCLTPPRSPADPPAKQKALDGVWDVEGDVDGFDLSDMTVTIQDGQPAVINLGGGGDVELSGQGDPLPGQSSGWLELGDDDTVTMVLKMNHLILGMITLTFEAQLTDANTMTGTLTTEIFGSISQGDTTLTRQKIPLE
jgi:hypothetical protein